MAQRDEIRAAGRLAGDLLADGVRLIEGVHRGIATRVFDRAGAAAEPVRVVHDTVSGAVYGIVRTAHALAPRVGATFHALRTSDAATGRWSDAPGPSKAVAALNGILGDTVAERYPELATPMTVRLSGHDVVLDPAGLAAAFPEATGRIALFVHGLCETDESWRYKAEERYGDASTTYGSRFQDELGYSPVYLRYASGLHVSDNGRRLADLLDDMVPGWPVPVAEIVIIGHSMGGLVARSACHVAETEGRSWAPLVTGVFCLGTPHLGAPLEKGVHVAAYVADRLPETRPIAELLNRRSAGVKDLRYGAVVEDDWREATDTELLRDRVTDVPFLTAAPYYFIGASVTSDEGHPLGAALGDFLVRIPSASGRGRRRKLPFEPDKGRLFGGLDHFDLLNHPAVYDQLAEWLSPPSARSPAAESSA